MCNDVNKINISMLQREFVHGSISKMLEEYILPTPRISIYGFLSYNVEIKDMFFCAIVIAIKFFDLIAVGCST